MPERQTSPAEVSPDSVDPSTSGADGVRPDPDGDAAPERRRDNHVQDASPDCGSRDTPDRDPAAEPSGDSGAGPGARPGAGSGADAGADSDRATDVMPPLVESTDEVPPADSPTTAAGPGDDADAPTELIPAARGRSGRRRRRALILAGAAVVLLAALYVVDLVHSAGTVPRGVTVAGQDIGGLSRADAEQRVRTAVEPRTTRPVAVAVGDVTSEVDPRAAGLAVDWTATIAQAGAQPLDPITRVRSFFTHREIGVVSTANDDALDTALQQLTPVVNRPPVEGSVRFDGVTPVPVPPVDGQELDVSAAHQVLERDWTKGTVVRLPVTVLSPTTTADQVTTAVGEVATPAVSGPVTVVGEKVTGTISPEVIAKALSFRADPTQGLVPELNKDIVHDALDPQLASSEQPGRDASLSFVGGKPVVTPSQDGRGIDYDATLKDLLTVLTKTGDARRITAVYAPQPAKLTPSSSTGSGSWA